MANAPGKCAFCGGRGLTKEHIIPHWCLDLLPGEMSGSITRDINNDEGRRRDGWRQPTPDLVVRDICATCNNGWLSDLERAASKQLGPLISSPTERAEVDTGLLAVWMTKTMLTAALPSRGSGHFILDEQYRWFYANRREFPGSAGWFGALHDGNLYSYSSTATRPVGTGTWRAVVNIGALVMMVWADTVSPFPGGKSILPSDVKPLLAQVFPSRRPRAFWPPPRVMDAHGLHVVAGLDHTVWDNWSSRDPDARSSPSSSELGVRTSPSDSGAW